MGVSDFSDIFIFTNLRLVYYILFLDLVKFLNIVVVYLLCHGGILSNYLCLNEEVKLRHCGNMNCGSAVFIIFVCVKLNYFLIKLVSTKKKKGRRLAK